MKHFALAILFFAAVYAHAATVTIKIIGIKKVKGHILIGLFNKQKGFPDIGKEYKGVSHKITKKIHTHTFVDVPPGYYAIAIVHDINKNGKVDYNFIGIPKEMYAFSGKSKAIGKPPFKEAKFKVKDKHTIKLKLK